MRANTRRFGTISAQYQFQLPPSHEGELRDLAVQYAHLGFQLPPSHEGEHRDGDPYQMNIISTPALA